MKRILYARRSDRTLRPVAAAFTHISNVTARKKFLDRLMVPI